MRDKEWLVKEVDRLRLENTLSNNPMMISNRDVIAKVSRLIDQLDEPKKVVIPQFIANWIESYRKKTLVELINDAVYSSDEDSQCFRRWFHEEMGFESNYDEFLSRVWLDGYTTEKEKLYRVELPTERLHHILTMHGDGKGHFFGKEHTNNFWYRTYLTEQEIKAIDERFWAFAKEVVENV